MSKRTIVTFREIMGRFAPDGFLRFRQAVPFWRSRSRRRGFFGADARFNEEDAADVLGIHAAGTDVHSGKISVEKHPDVARQIARQFPNVSKVATTLRESLSASHNNWGAMLYDVASDTPHFAPVRNGEYQSRPIKNIVDRVGGGDSLGAGLIFALNTAELSEPRQAVAFAVAASCLAHLIVGDINNITRAEAEALMEGSGAGRVIR